MFKSEFSGKLIGPRIAPVKVVVEKRPVKYRNVISKKAVSKFAPAEKKEILSEGWETVRELAVAPDEVATVKKTYGV